MKRGENVQNRQLQTWLTEDEYAQIATEWDTQKLFREELKDKPSQLKRYEDKLKEAIMMRTVRRHINWNNHRPDLKEDLAPLVQDIKRRICGIASAGSPLFSV